MRSDWRKSKTLADKRLNTKKHHFQEECFFILKKERGSSVSHAMAINYAGLQQLTKK